MKMRLLIICIVYILSSINTEQVKPLQILALFPFQGKSHGIIFNNFVEALLTRGHNITHVTYFPINKQVSNYRYISMATSGAAKILEDEYLLESTYSTIWEVYKFVVLDGNNNCKALLENKNVQNLWKTNAKFDLVLAEHFNSDCPLALAYKLGAPVVGVTGCTLMAWQYDRFGVPYNPSFVPQQFLDGDSKPTLFQRVERTFFHVYFNLYYKLIGQRTDEETIKKYFNDVPHLEELARNIKFVLLNTHMMLFGSNLLPSNLIEVGGYHVAKTKPLPAELQKFIDESEHGVIYVSFGSIIKSSISDSNKINKIIGALSQLPQRVIWKWETSNLPDESNKIYISKWLPQKDILAHPNVVAFLSHCGLVSTTEAITFGVPIVGMPIFGDQPSNAAAIEEKGFGVRIKLSELTTDNLVNKFKTVLDPNFRKRVKLLSKAWSDRPMSAMDTAIFWTEFAARNHNFTFRAAAADVPLYQYLCLDVLLVLILFFVGFFFITKYLLSAIFSNARKNKDKKL